MKYASVEIIFLIIFLDLYNATVYRFQNKLQLISVARNEEVIHFIKRI